MVNNPCRSSPSTAIFCFGEPRQVCTAFGLRIKWLRLVATRWERNKSFRSRPCYEAACHDLSVSYPTHNKGKMRGLWQLDTVKIQNF